MDEVTDVKKLLNINVGVLGHVDSGKTSLSKVLSSVGSTAAFDKHPQSKERGITIDLGFSSFVIPCPQHIKSIASYITHLQVTLVDCPGHASLIRTIIGGASIIDMMILVIDVTKGIQTQTAECLVIGEITCNKMLVVLNKIDLLAEEKRSALIDRMTKKIHKTLETTKFRNCPVIPVSARPGGGDLTTESKENGLFINDLVNAISNIVEMPKRDASGPFLFNVDHCFSVRGQGTVMTGTVAQGVVKINDTIEIPSLKATRKVKSMQMFRRPVNEAFQGDRVGICVTQFDPKSLERGVVCAPNYLRQTCAIVASVRKITYFKSACKSKAKFHVSMIHETLMAKASFFTAKTDSEFSLDNAYEWADELDGENTEHANYFVLLEFEKPVTITDNQMYIASKLDTDINSNICRLAFHGEVNYLFPSKDLKTELKSLKIYKYKSKQGTVERIVNDYEIIVKSMFKKEFDMKRVEGMRVTLVTNEEGSILSSFGLSGKFKISVQNGIKDANLIAKGSPVVLKFKKYIFDKSIKQ